MKGISTTIAVVLLVMIVVALIAFLWLFANNLFNTVTSSGKASVENFGHKAGGCLLIENVNPRTGVVTVRNCGNIPLNNLTAFVDNLMNASDSNVLYSGSIDNFMVGLTVGKHDIFVTADNAQSMHMQVEVPDLGQPQWFYNHINSTLAGSPVLHSLRWTSNVGLSGYIFSFDNCTNSFVNDSSWVPMTGMTSWSNVTKTINSTVPCTIRWKVYANDTNSRWSISPEFNYITGSGGGGSGCGDGYCESGEEDQYNCPQDCGYPPSYCDFHVSILTDTYTIGQSNKVYCLDNNVHIDGKNATNFSSGIQNSTLDCRGYNVDGNITTNTYGVYLNGPSTNNNTIKNCNITDFDSGIYLFSSSNNTLNNNIGNNNYDDGIYLGSSSNNTLSNNIGNNNYDGIWIDSSSNYNTINNNTNNGNFYGIWIDSSSNYNTINNNTNNGNTAYGIYLDSNSNYNTINNNVFNNNKNYGIYLRANSNNNITNNTVNGNTAGGGILISTSSVNNTINNNVFNNNKNYGILLAGPNNTLSNNTANNNTIDGIYLFSSSNNTLSNNMANNNTIDGVDIFSGSNNTLTNNTANYNNYGFLLSSGSNNIITGGSIALSSTADYYLGSAVTTNNFINTNFTSTRKITFSNTTSWFNYQNDSTSGIWLKTNVSAVAAITRKLVNWNQVLMQWNDTFSNNSGSITANYNVSGLLQNTNYSVYNNTQFLYTLNSSFNGEVDFNITLPQNQEINITVQEKGCDYIIQQWELPYIINQNNKYYCLVSDRKLNTYVASAINFNGIQNTTIDCLGHTIGGINNMDDMQGIYLTGSSTKNNTVKNCNIRDFDRGIYVYYQANNITLINNTIFNNEYGIEVDAGNNIIINNSVYNNSHNGITINSNNNILFKNKINNNKDSGVVIFNGQSNNITNCSIFDNSYDYYLSGAATSNNFTDTNFTSARTIFFYDTTSWFNYQDDSSQSIWLKTNVSGIYFEINRILNIWSQTNISWNESASSVVTSNYNITGLLNNANYTVYNFSVPVYTLNASSCGCINFKINLNTTTREIKVQKV